MARNFNMVSPAVWRSKRSASLPDDARLLQLYLLTNEHVTSAGCYRLLAGYACADLGGWTPERYSAALAALEGAEVVATDQITSEVLILRWFKHCPPTNSKHYQGTSRLVAAIESDHLRQMAAAGLNAAWEAFQAAQAAKAQSGVPSISDRLRQHVRQAG